MTATVLTLIASGLSALIIVARLLMKKQIERDTRRQVELEREHQEALDYKATREKLDAVEDPQDATLDELREWLRQRGGDKS